MSYLACSVVSTFSFLGKGAQIENENIIFPSYFY